MRCRFMSSFSSFWAMLPLPFLCKKQYIKQDSKLLASDICWYIRFPPCWCGTEIKPSAIESDSLKPLSVIHSKLKFEWQPIFQKKKKIYIKPILCNFSMRMLKYFYEKTPLIAAQISLNLLFLPNCPDCPNSPNRRIPVPKCGLLTNCIQNLEIKGTYCAC